jgi:hypothetical protein
MLLGLVHIASIMLYCCSQVEFSIEISLTITGSYCSAKLQWRVLHAFRCVSLTSRLTQSDCLNCDLFGLSIELFLILPQL